MGDYSDYNESFYSCLYAEWKYGYEKECFWVSGILLSSVSFLGLLGNFFNIIVLCQPKMRKNNFYNLLLFLAFFDILFILSYGISVAYKSMACYPFNKLVGPIAYPLINIGLVGSIYMTLAISAERYIGICHPSVILKRRVWTFVLPVLFVTFAYASPKFFERYFYFENGTLVAKARAFRSNETYQHVYHLWTATIVVSVIPFISLLFMNGSIIAHINKTSEKVKNLGRSHQRKGMNSTKILFWIVLMFLTFHIPRVIYKCLFYLGPENRSTWYWVEPYSRLSLICNSSLNFVVYCMVGKNFRREFCKAFHLRSIFQEK